VLACLEDRPPHIHGDGEQTRDFTFVGDAVRANLLAADAEGAAGAVINVAGGTRTSLNTLLAHVRELTGSRVEPLHGPPRAGDVRDSLADLGRAETMLGYRPEVGLRDGLAVTIEHFRRASKEH
jgi:nucleoside-diphosphate-sugar epimerase